MRRSYLAILAVALTVIGVYLTGCGGAHSSYKRLAAPQLPSNVKASSCPKGDNHSLGECLPTPKPGQRGPQLQGGGIRGCDLSNNDPVYGVGAWRAIRAHGTRFCYFKINESTTYTDSTAPRMVHDARAAGVIVGGYDFLHVCWTSARAEADLFARDLIAAHAAGQGALAPAADAEYGSGSSCNARGWFTTWRVELAHQLLAAHLSNVWSDTYTGEWWWGPNMGCWWGGGRGWISGYVGSVSQVPMPCGATLYIWQYTDHGFNGYSSGDYNIWERSPAEFDTAIGKPAGPSKATLGKWRRGKLNARRHWNRGKCGDHPLKPRCPHYRRLVVAYQLDFQRRAHYPPVRCWGKHAKKGEAVCDVLRPTVPAWADAAAHSRHQYWLRGCQHHSRRHDCVVFAQRTAWFNGLWRSAQQRF